eukprot:TRINITY_DN581_c1_g1_i3.p1 TRINITY_DN581_c1_g1~~TRINITY_DN581_c1_g1_i3.p1  ORF type:complete len:745 (+),score=153.70 TRINITY_DN581_c1_g1_i3:71-2305(+)
MATIVRKLVSKKKRRFEWGEFDLDLSYITDRVVAMGFPSEALEGLYRNKMRDVKRFLDSLHPGRYKVYNLCSENRYDHSKFGGPVEEFPFDDHYPPSLEIIPSFCQSVSEWLDKHPENIVAVHCKAGKGRTGTMISCWLLYSGYCQTWSEATRLFGNKRTRNGKGITIPSQFRYVRYFDLLLKKFSLPPQIPHVEPRILTRIAMHGVPNFNIGGGCEPFIGIEQRGKTVYYSKPLKLRKAKSETIDFYCGQTVLAHDITIEFFNRNTKGLMFSLSFHTAFITNDYLHFRRMELDKACKDNAHKHFPQTFQIELFFTPVAALPYSNSDDADPSASASSIIPAPSSSTSSLAPLQPNQTSSSSSLLSDPHQVIPDALDPDQDPELLLQNLAKELDRNAAVVEDLSSARSSTGIPLSCASCNDPITADSVSISNGTRHWHWACVRCMTCKQQPRDDVIFNENGDAVCSACERDKGFFKLCARCAKVIKQDNFEEVGELSWHTECFLCDFCERHIADSSFVLEKNKPVCSLCLDIANVAPSSSPPTSSSALPPIISTLPPLMTTVIQPSSPLIIEPAGRVIPPPAPVAAARVTPVLPVIAPKLEFAPPPLKASNNNTHNTNHHGRMVPARKATLELAPILMCPGCHEGVLPGLPRTIALGHVWHRECFVCAGCRRSFPDSHFFIQDEKPFCDSCDKDKAAEVAPICGGCHTPITDYEITEALGRSWHIDCFICAHCKVQIAGMIMMMI